MRKNYDLRWDHGRRKRTSTTTRRWRRSSAGWGCWGGARRLTGVRGLPCRWRRVSSRPSTWGRRCGRGAWTKRRKRNENVQKIKRNPSLLRWARSSHPIRFDWRRSWDADSCHGDISDDLHRLLACMVLAQHLFTLDGFVGTFLHHGLLKKGGVSKGLKNFCGEK